ncbi:S8 family serine peptidase [Halomicrobium urmianum]|uniref:S8 family serine peptidase n=1 Tax=Halomicrobium urmianum TaxID=1586233 RepID=UPI001CDA190A|nr:S8 family serine peptidase [Halomicrobium urmianum]
MLQGLGSLGLAAAGGVTAARPRRRSGEKPDEVILGAADEADAGTVASMASSASPADASVVHVNQTLGYVALQIPGAERAREAVRSAMANRTEVEYVEDNVAFETQLAPNDPGFDQQYAPQLVNADDAWDETLGDADVTIAVVDTGVAYDHPDLASGFGSDPGRDFADSDGDPAPDTSDEAHGTHVAGCASADTDNGVGVAGPSDSRLLVARALDETGRGSLSDIADAIQWATDRGADVINVSLGGGSDTRTMKRAVEYAADQHDALVVCAAGNSGQSGVAYPARYEECVAVSAVDPNEELADFSNYGSAVELAAPGVNVLSTMPSDGYGHYSGTSMAAPVVAGVAALGKAANPDLGAEELRRLLRETAVDVGLSSDEQGAGRVDAAAIVASAGSTTGGSTNESPTADATASPAEATVGETVTFDGSGSGDPDGSVERYEWALGDGSTATGATVEHAYDAAGEYEATLTVTDGDGATATDAVTVAVEAAAQCDQTVSGSVQSSLSGWWDDDPWRWNQRLASTCEVAVTLEGPNDADFDLYVTADGRTPSGSDYDALSASDGSAESVTLSSIDGAVGILVNARRGSGEYTLRVEERGSDSA